MLARGKPTVRSAAPSSARSPVSYADASTSSDGYGLGAVAPAAAPCTSGRAFGSTRASASSEATSTRARRRFYLSSRRRCRRNRRDLSIYATRAHLHYDSATSLWRASRRDVSISPVSSHDCHLYWHVSRAPALMALLRLHHFACARPRHPSLTTAAPPGGDTPLPTGPPFCAYRQPYCTLRGGVCPFVVAGLARVSRSKSSVG